eukprot:SAG31_NODE_523_length_14545_cov_4.805067_4_plen_113_part_00
MALDLSSTINIVAVYSSDFKIPKPAKLQKQFVKLLTCDFYKCELDDPIVRYVQQLLRLNRCKVITGFGSIQGHRFRGYCKCSRLHKIVKPKAKKRVGNASVSRQGMHGYARH